MTQSQCRNRRGRGREPLESRDEGHRGQRGPDLNLDDADDRVHVHVHVQYAMSRPMRLRLRLQTCTLARCAHPPKPGVPHPPPPVFGPPPSSLRRPPGIAHRAPYNTTIITTITITNSFANHVCIEDRSQILNWERLTVRCCGAVVESDVSPGTDLDDCACATRSLTVPSIPNPKSATASAMVPRCIPTPWLAASVLVLGNVRSPCGPPPGAQPEAGARDTVSGIGPTR
ncbi:hypothetical protein CSOJ01_12340 [Colletotrichum sojae]|uniref:Uncharacterized protein n=1 Tax=Colletotrichum sojae TaxID=2175907 RepID=A0A8H6IV52_9PEZI|nr:hypothetical protein CSOJ01_12340 [Colletotrichum sojae]